MTVFRRFSLDSRYKGTVVEHLIGPQYTYMNEENKDQEQRAKERNWEKDWDEEKSSTAEKKSEDDVSEKD